MTPLVLRTPEQVRVIQVVEVRAARGAGTEADPVRHVTQYWLHEDGVSQLLAERDPAQDVR